MACFNCAGSCALKDDSLSQCLKELISGFFFDIVNSLFFVKMTFVGTVAKCILTVIPRFIRGIQKSFIDVGCQCLDCQDNPPIKSEEGNDKMGILQ